MNPRWKGTFQWKMLHRQGR